MIKWADYIVTNVNYNNNIIDNMKIFEDKGEELGDNYIKNRDWVVTMIKKGYLFITGPINKQNNEITKGEKIHIVSRESEEYISTDPNEKTRDNLGDLPNIL